jgi:hypothetical protein
MGLVLATNEDEFENLCKWVARDNFGPNVFLFALRDQKGIDIYWTDSGKYHVIQCKLRTKPDAAELMRSLNSDFQRAKEYFGDDLKQFIFATTAPAKLLEEKIIRRNGAEESVANVCSRLASENGLQVVTWSGDYLMERVNESPFLLRHLLNKEEGADLIGDDFVNKHISKYKAYDKEQLKFEYYAGQEDIQWYGVLQNLDAPRAIYESIVNGLNSAFQKNKSVASVIRGDGGSGKSVLMRRIALNLGNEYTVYWLDKNIEAFLKNEMVYDIKCNPNSKYVILLEDWYRNIESAQNLPLAQKLFNDLKHVPNARLIIGDRKGKRKLYDEFVLQNNIYDLENKENVKLLQNIFEKMPQWKESISQKELLEISNATLFICLFVFCYGNPLDNESLIDKYKKIFKSDYEKFLDSDNLFIRGIANTLYLYAKFYSDFGIFFSVQTFADLITFYTGQPMPAMYASDVNRLYEFPLLKKYVNLLSINTKDYGVVTRLKFHHDTMAEHGWNNKHELVEIGFDENAIDDLIGLLKQNRQSYDLQKLYYRMAKQPNEKGKIAAREYLKLERPDKNFNSFCFCLELLKDEEIAKKSAREFLNTDKPYVNHWAFSKSLDLLRSEEIAKKSAREFLNTDRPYINKEAFSKSLDLLRGEEIAKKSAREFLNTDRPYVNHWAFSKSLDLLRSEEIAKKSAREFLNTDRPYINKEAFSKSLDLLRGEEITKEKAREFMLSDNREKIPAAFSSSLIILDSDAAIIAVDIVKNWKSRDWSHIYHSIRILNKLNCSNELINSIITEIIATKNNDWHRYGEILKIPLFNIPIWMKETEYIISNWRRYTGVKRNYLMAISYSYNKAPDKLKEISIGIIKNWRHELSSNFKHKAYFTRFLANINVCGNEALKKEVIEICREIYDAHRKKPLQLTKDLENWIFKIATLGEFPIWDLEHLQKKE